MSKMKMMGIMLGALALGSGSMMHQPMTESEDERKKRLSEAERKKRLSEAERKKRLSEAEHCQNIARGLTKFIYGQNFLYALNQKSADKKARKRGWL